MSSIIVIPAETHVQINTSKHTHATHVHTYTHTHGYTCIPTSRTNQFKKPGSLWPVHVPFNNLCYEANGDIHVACIILIHKYALYTLQ